VQQATYAVLAEQLGDASRIHDAVAHTWVSYNAHSKTATIFHLFIMFVSVCRGFIEFLTRVSCYGAKLGRSPDVCLRSLLHLVNASNAVAKRSKVTRKSTTGIRHFVFG
jgi:prolipoprotein diacylglyceryltransferase